MTLSDLQRIIRDTYDAKDRSRGVDGTFMWLRRRSASWRRPAAAMFKSSA
jgi:hypothetical protein